MHKIDGTGLKEEAWVTEQFSVPMHPTETTIIKLKGGPGSGHHGHAGRHGKIGGSVPKGTNFQPGMPGPNNSEYVDLSMGYDIIANNVFTHIMPDASDTLKRSLGVLDRADVARAAKNDIVTELSQRTGLDYDRVNEFIRQWASTSNRGYESISIQEAFAEEFGVELSSWQKEILKPYNERIARWKKRYDLFDEAQAVEDKYVEAQIQKTGKTRDTLSSAEIKEALDNASAEWNASHTMRFSHVMTVSAQPDYIPILPKEGMKRLARAMYDLTQERLKDAPDTLILFRGIVVDDYEGAQPGDIAQYEGNAIESWSASKQVAYQFSGQPGSAVLSISIPKENVVGTCISGFGCLNELEYVFLGSIPGSSVRVIKTY
jgi:hypothetical protein